MNCFLFFPRLLICWLISMLVLGTALAAPSSLVFEPASIDLGRIPQKTILHKEIHVSNKGNTTVEILSIHADCGCTTSTLKTMTLAPGQSTVLEVAFDSRNFAGPVSRHIQLNTTQGMQELELHTVVAPYENWDIDPMPFMVPPSLKGQICTGTLTVKYRGKTAGRITGILSQVPWLQAEIIEATDTKTWQVRVTKATDAPVGTFSTLVTLKTDEADAPEIVIPVIVPVASILRVSPNPVVMPRGKIGQAASAAFRLTGWQSDIPPHVTSERGEVVPLGKNQGEFIFELRWTPQEAGSFVWPIKILENNQLQIEISALIQVDA